MKYNLFAILFFALGIMACNSLSMGFELEGNLKDAPAGKAVNLEKVELNNSLQPIGNATLDNNGKFVIKLKEKPLPGIYLLRIENKRSLLFVNDGDKKIKLTGDWNGFESFDFKVSGSPASSEYAQQIQKMIKHEVDNKYFLDYIQNGTYPLVNAVLSTIVLPNYPMEQALPIFKGIEKKLGDAMPGSSYSKDFSTLIQQIQSQKEAEVAAQKIKVGEDAPDISLPDPQGKTRSLSSLKGNIVLLDFWASWCGPCRKENPRVVDIYKRYKDKGFTVFSVSLDGFDSRSPSPQNAKETAMSQWKNAIQQDGLIWENHVSDLKKWDSAPAATYGVRAIPQTFLLDKNGKIAAVNPRENLEEEIKKLIQ